MPGKNLGSRRPLALEDISEHAQHIAKESVKSALRFVDKIDETIDLIKEYPEARGLVELEDRSLRGMRAKLVRDFPRYAVVYLVEVDGIEVVRVLAGGQEFEKNLLFP